MYRLFAILVCCLLMPQMSGAAELSPQRETEIRNAVIAYARQKQVNFSNEIRLKRFVVAGAPSLPEGVIEYEVIAPQQWGGWGYANLAVIARKADQVIGNINVRTEVEVMADMAFTTQEISFGSVLAASDIVMRKSDVGAAHGRYLASLKDAVGKKARMALKANVPLRNDMLEKVPLIKAGQMVLIVAENEHIRVTATGKAKSAGALGDTIIVQNLNSLKELPAKIVDSETVRIVY